MFSSKTKDILLFWLIAILSFGVAGYAIFGYLILTPGTTASPAQIVTYAIYRTEIVLHALFASIALILGAVQMNRKFREKFPKTNVIFRSIYFVSVIIGAITGFLLAFHVQGGLVNIIGFSMLAVVWMYSCIKSILALKNKDMPSFRVWIVRNYALTFSVVTLRIYLGIFFGTLGYLEFENFYPTLGFLCWIPNIVFVEWFLLNKHKV